MQYTCSYYYVDNVKVLRSSCIEYRGTYNLKVRILIIGRKFFHKILNLTSLEYSSSYVMFVKKKKKKKRKKIRMDIRIFYRNGFSSIAGK